MMVLFRDAHQASAISVTVAINVPIMLFVTAIGPIWKSTSPLIAT